MSHRCLNPPGSILTLLSCSSDEFSYFYEGPIATASLVKDAKKAISHNQAFLQAAGEGRYCLDELLLGMLDHAPDDSGQRYVAVVLHIANKKGSDAVTDAAKAWLDYLFFPMLSLSKQTKTTPSSSQTPTFDDTAEKIKAAYRADQRDLRAAVCEREQYRCAITKTFDRARAMELIAKGNCKEVPPSYQMSMEAAYIIPLSLSEDNDSVAYTWDMLNAWTGLDVHQLVGSKINSPENAIFMNDMDLEEFGSFFLYFDKDEYPDSPNKYKVLMAQNGMMFANGEITADVEFVANTRIPCPNSQFLRIHAAFAKVLGRSQVAAYMGRVEMSNQSGAPTDAAASEENDFATVLRYRLLAAATN